MTYIALTIFIILTVTALIHVAWAFGVIWPGKDKQSLVNTVIGHPKLTQMPGTALTLAVAFSIFAAAVCAPWAAGLVNLPLPGWMQISSAWVLTFILFARGLSTYLLKGPLSGSVEPFRTLDRRYFAPIILLLSAGYLTIALGS